MIFLGVSVPMLETILISGFVDVIVVIKFSDKSNLREKCSILAYHLKLESMAA